MRTLTALGAAGLSAGVLVSGLAVAPATTTAATAAPAVTAASPKVLKAKGQKRFFKNCKRSGRFNERRFDYSADVVYTGRCTILRIRGVKLISSYNGHHPSASKALDIMVNMAGSCHAGRQTGNRIARYLMNHARQHDVRYLIWKNSYWASTSRPTKHKNWRHGIAGGSCTTKHYDHVHVAFR